MNCIRIKQPGGFENIVLEEEGVSSLSANSVRVRWHATSLNYHDLLVVKGLIPVEGGRIPMSDGAGEVTEVGEEVNQWEVGDKVMSLFFPRWDTGRPTKERTRWISGENTDGYLREESVLPAQALTRMPKGYSFAEAATLPCAAVTAWRGLVVEGQLQQGQSILIEGTGGVSIFALQIAQAMGARVFATSSSQSKLDRLKALGAVEVVNYREEERWGRAIYKLAGQGVDQVIDVGGGATFNQSVDAVAMDGHISSIGILDGRAGNVVFPKLFFKHVRVTGLAVGSREMQNALVDFIDDHGIKPIIDRSFAFGDLARAFEHQESGQHFGKIVLEW